MVYSIKKSQANAKMIEVGTEVSKIKKELDDLLKLLESFTIYSDSNGMITGISEGEATLFAKHESFSDSIKVKVLSP